MKRQLFLGAALATAMTSAMSAARADVITTCDSVATVGDWAPTRGCSVGDMIFTLGRVGRGVADILVDFEISANVVSLTLTQPASNPVFGAIFYTVTFADSSVSRVTEIQLFGTRQASANDNQGGAILIASTDPAPTAIPVVVELRIGATEVPAASPPALGAPPIPSDPSLFDSAAFDARTTLVTLQINAVRNARQDFFGLESVTTAFVLSAADVPAPSSLALVIVSLMTGVALRRRS